VQYTVREFTCNACTNRCDIKEFDVAGEKTYWGDKCSDRFRKQVKVARTPVIEDLVAFRERQLEKDWLQAFAAGEGGGELRQLAERASLAGRLNSATRNRVGMPRAMYFYQRHPFWKAYFDALGCELLISGPTTKAVANAGIEETVAEPCFPIQIAHGHLKELTEAELDFVVVPAHINDATSNPEVQSHLCPFGQTLPFLLKHSPVTSRLRARYLSPLIHFRQGKDFVEKELWRQLGMHFASRRHHRLAVTLAFAAQEAFGQAIRSAGKRALEQIQASEASGIVLVGRPYNLYDPGLNLNLAAKLRQQYGVNIVPLDFIDSDAESLSELNSNMFWNYGRKILQTTLWSRRYPNLHLIYLTNFMCGPDSFLKTFAAQGAGQPFLTLQFDGHGNDAGMMTRCEAYLDSKGLL